MFVIGATKDIRKVEKPVQPIQTEVIAILKQA